MPPYVLKQEKTAIAPWIVYPKDPRHEARRRAKNAKTPGTEGFAQNEMDSMMGLLNLLKDINPTQTPPPTNKSR